MRRSAALLLAAGLVCAACSSASEPHGSPVLIQVFWIASGERALVWTLAPDPSVATVATPAGQEVDFVFDRRLDGNRIEDSVPQTDPPITVGWPGSSGTFANQVLYNSEPIYGGTSAYVLLQPARVGFPAADTVTFSLDKTRLTSAYGDQMTGPAQIDVATGPFSASFALPAGADGAASVPGNFAVPIVFSNRTAPTAALAPFVEVKASGRDLPFSLTANPSDPTVVYLSPASCLGGWPPDAPIEVNLLAGLPDAFGVGLATTTGTSFSASEGVTPGPDGGCTAADAGAD